MSLTSLIVGGTAGLGRGIATQLARRGERVIITGRDLKRTHDIAKEIGATTSGNVSGLALDLTEPSTIAKALASVDSVDHLVIGAIERDNNTARDYSIERALRLVTLKLVGYAEVVHALSARLTPQAAIVLIGGLAKDRPYPGSTTVSTVNGGVVGLVNTLAVELGPIRVNGLHPGVVDDTDAWKDKPAAVLDPLRARTPTGRLASTEDIAGAALFLLDNRSINGVNLVVDGGVLLK